MKLIVSVDCGTHGKNYIISGDAESVLGVLSRELDETVVEVYIKKKQHTDGTMCCNPYQN